MNIQGSNETYGFDIAVKTDQQVLSPLSIDYSNMIYSTHGHLVLVDCVNNTGIGCQNQTDGPGVAHFAITPLNYETTAPTTGRLFAITYNITGLARTTISFQTGCSPTGGTSIAPDTCVTIVFFDSTTNAAYPDPETSQTAGFGHVAGDVNSDCVVDIRDLVLIAVAFDSTPGLPNWNPAADINNDGAINVEDLSVAGANFMHACN